ncbi:apolipoprotein N-acyltransferase [Blastopirellula marina]|uniref:Apolipoprotein N-acyltransferase n=1 Tax=Blastopirellula marina TaxID=124 RepID=A0A2S8GPF1_9BACT|nr:apolipoprotein N-acyltransferase [Blastopirellula marina]
MLLALGFPQWNLVLLAWIAPIGWLMLVQAPSLPKYSYRILYLSGLAFWLIVLVGIGNAHIATRLLGWPVLSGYLAVYTPIFVLFCRPLVHRFRVPIPIVAPLVWTALEYVRAYFATGFSMAQLGHSQVDLVPLIQISSVTGAYGVSFLMMLTTSLLFMAVPKPESIVGNAPQASGAMRGGWIAAALVLVFAWYNIGWNWETTGYQLTAADDVEPVIPGGRPVLIGLVQGSIDTQFGDPTQAQRTYDQYAGLSDELMAEWKRLDLIIWPETTMGPYMPLELTKDFAPPADWNASADVVRPKIELTASKFRTFVRDLAVQRWHTPLLLGTSVVRYGNQRVDHFNAAIHVDREGAIVERYEKVHPVMFGEYVPFGDMMPFIYDLMPIGGGLTPGEGPVVIDVEGVHLVPCICFENTVPQLVAGQLRELDAAEQRVDALVTLTNDGWFYGSGILDLHLMCARFRAVEHHRPMLVAANTGISAVIDAQGTVVEAGPRQQTALLVTTVSPTSRPLSVYTTYGDWFAAGCTWLSLPLALIGLWLDRRARRVVRSSPAEEPSSV